MVLQCIWTYTSTERLCTTWRRHATRSDVDLPFVESIWHQFECWWCLWRNRCAEGEILTELDQSTWYGLDLVYCEPWILTYKQSPHRTLSIRCRIFWTSPCKWSLVSSDTGTNTHRVYTGNLCLDISLCCLVHSVHTGTLHYRTMPQVKGHCRNISWEKQWSVWPTSTFTCADGLI